MTINERRASAEGLADGARRVAIGRKKDSIGRGWLAIERLPNTIVGLSLEGEVETWTNVARLADAIVTACDYCLSSSDRCEIPKDSVP
jgi:hypothetical protein